MAIFVIDLFEVINVQHQQQGVVARAGYPINFALNYRLKMATVGKTRQRVLQRHGAQAIKQGLQILCWVVGGEM